MMVAVVASRLTLERFVRGWLMTSSGAVSVFAPLVLPLHGRDILSVATVLEGHL